MAIIESTQKCEHCNFEYKWEVQLRERISEIQYPDVDIMRKDYAHPRSIFHKDEALIRMRCRCPNCDKLNNFEYNLNRKT